MEELNPATPDLPPEMSQPASPPRVVANLTRCYALLGISLPLLFIPTMGVVTLLGAIGTIIGAAWAYRLRRGGDAMGVTHGTWMVRSVWLSSAVLTLAIVTAGAIISANGDHAAFDALGAAIHDKTASPEQINAATQAFYEVNGSLIMWATIGCLALPLLYTLARFIKGYRRLKDGQAIDDVRTWWL